MENISMSIVMVVHNNDNVLEQTLQRFLQTAEAVSESEVIVVDDTSTDETPDILKRMKADNPRLHTTFMPQSVYNKSRLQLALTVGAKAARHRRIVLADITLPPVSSEWLSGLAEGTVALVRTRRKKSGYSLRYRRFDTFEAARPRLMKTGRRGSYCQRQAPWYCWWRRRYDAIAVDCDHVFDAIKCFDLPLTRWKLLKLRLSV